MNPHATPQPRTLQSLLREADIPHPPLPDIPIAGISSDTRSLRPGELFVALSGLRTDARSLIPAAVRAGAAAIVCEPPEEGRPAPDAGPVPLIHVPNARVALATLWDAWYGHPGRRLRLVGVTGTNGKTTVSTLLCHLLTAAGIPSGLIGTVECRLPGGQPAPHAAGMTTPDPAELYATLARMAEEASAHSDAAGDTVGDAAGPAAGKDPRPVVVMEVTSHALALGKVAPLCFDLGIFTNLTPEHLDLHGTMAEYYAAKRRLFAVSREVVLNADDRWGRMLLAEPLPVRHWHICHAAGLDGLPPDRMCPTGEGGCTRFFAEQLRDAGEEGLGFKLTSPDIRLRLNTPLIGSFNVMNTLEAAVAALALGVPPATLRDAVATFSGVPGRMERIPLPPAAPFSAYIDFAHTPDALRHLLASALALRGRGRRVVLLFGCGGDRDRGKRREMAHIASRMADATIITSDNSRGEDPEAILRDILSGMDKESEFAVIPDRAEAIRYAVRHARVGDILLLAGKGHEQYEITAEGMHPFSERDILLAAVRERLDRPDPH